MTTDELIAKFFDEQINIISKQISRNELLNLDKTVKLIYKDEPYVLKLLIERAVVEIKTKPQSGYIADGKTVDYSVESNFTVGAQPPTPNKDAGWDSIEELMNDPEFVQQHNEIMRD